VPEPVVPEITEVEADRPADTPAPRAAGSGSRRRRHLSIGGAIIWFSVSYGGAILGYLAVNAFAARLLDDGFGYFVIAVTVSTLFGQLGLMGVHRGGLREAARMAPDDTAVLSDLRRGVRAIVLTVLPVTALITGLVTYAVLDAPDPGDRVAVAVGMAVLVYLGGQQKLWANYLRGFGHVRFASLLEGRSGGALASAGQGVLIGLVLLFQPGWGLPGALGALAVGLAIPVVFAWLTVHRVWRKASGRGPLLRDMVAVVRRYWRFASNLLGGYLNSTVELWIAGLLLTGTTLSHFSAAQRLSVLLAVPLTSLGVVFSPVVSRLIGHDDRRLERLLRTGATLAVGTTAIVWIPMLVAPGWLLGTVFGSGFAAAAPILVLLTLGSFANVLSGMCGTALTMSRHESVVAIVQWVAVALRVGLGVVAMLAFGAVGLGASAALVTAGLYAALWIATRRRMGLWTHPTLRPSLRLLRSTKG